MTTPMNKLAIALAAAGITAALAQAPATTPAQSSATTPAQAPAAAPAPATAAAPAPGSTLPPNLVAEPTASMSRADGPGADVGKQLTDAINADQSLKGSKITVQPEDGKITLSGVTESREQAKKVGQMAAQAVGVENVTNVIRDSEATVIDPRSPPQQHQAGAEQGQQQDQGQQQEQGQQQGQQQQQGQGQQQ